MRTYLEAKLILANRDVQKYLPGFTHISAGTQFDLKLKKRLNSTWRHGCQHAKNLKD